MKLPTLYALEIYADRFEVISWKPYRETRACYYVGDPADEKPDRIHRSEADLSPESAWERHIGAHARWMEESRQSFLEHQESLARVVAGYKAWIVRNRGGRLQPDRNENDR